MKKRGFTLIELLAVIIVVAILTLITVPIISNIMTSVKMKALKDSAYGIMQSSNLYYAQYGVSDTVRFDIDNDKIESTESGKTIKYSGQVKEGSVIINKSGKIALYVSDGENCVYKNYDDKDVIEVPKSDEKCHVKEGSPVIYLGDNPSIPEIKDLMDRVKDLEENKADKSNLESMGTIILDKAWPIGSVYVSLTEETAEKVHNKFGGTWQKIEDKFLLSAGSTYAINTTGGSASTTLAVGNLPSHNHSIPALKGTAASTGSGYLIGYTYANRTTSTVGDHRHYTLEDALKEWGTQTTTFSETLWQWWRDHAEKHDSSYHKWSKMGNDASLSPSSPAGSHAHTYTDYYASSISGIQAHTHSVTTNASTTGNQGSGTSFTNMPPYITVYMYKRIS